MQNERDKEKSYPRELSICRVARAKTSVSGNLMIFSKLNALFANFRLNSGKMNRRSNVQAANSLLLIPNST
jgi:hypothetical protein